MDPSRLRSRIFGRYVALVLLVLCMLTALLVIIIWLAVQPKKLEYSIERSSISGYNLTNDGHLNATFHFLLRARNPDRRVGFYYDKVDIMAWYEGKILFVGHVDPFYQRTRNVTDMERSMATNDVVVHRPVAEHFKRERDSGDVKLEVKISGKIRLKIGVFKVHRTLDVLCGPFEVPFSSSKVFKRVFCDVDISF